MRSLVERIRSCGVLALLLFLLLLAGACGNSEGSGLLALSITGDSTLTAASASRVVLVLPSQLTRTYQGSFPLAGNAPLILEFPDLPASSSPVAITVRAESGANCVVASATKDVTIQAGAKTSADIVLTKSATACTATPEDAGSDGRSTPQDAGAADSSADVGGTAGQGGSGSGGSGGTGGQGGTGGSLDGGVPPTDAQLDVAKDVPARLDGNDAPGAVLLRIAKLGTGSGTVASSAAGLPSFQCGADCNIGYAVNSKVTLTATPDGDSVFVGWMDAGTCAASPTCDITMSGAQNVTAIFDTAKTLTVINEGAGKGTIVSTPAGIACGSTCVTKFKTDSTITLTATTSDPDLAFAGWTGACSGIGDCKVTLRGDQVIGAVFSRRYTQVSAGNQHTCAIRVGGQVECWGAGSVGKPGDGQATPPLGSFASVSAGESHTCGVKLDGSVACWGRNLQGQATAPAGTFRSVAAGADSTCGVQLDGTVACWGGIAETNPVTGSFTDITLGSNFGCGLRSGGGVVCWNWGTSADYQVIAPTGSFSMIDAGNGRACGVLSGGSAFCWGAVATGQLAAPTGAFQSVSMNAAPCGVRTNGDIMCWNSTTGGSTTTTGFDSLPAGPFSQISVGGGHACALRPSGAIACFGSDGAGQATIPGM